MKTYKNEQNHSSRMWAGLIVLIIGVVFLMSNFGISMPHWVISWHTFLIVIGLVIGAKRNFSGGGGWLIMVIIGGYFTLQDITNLSLSRFYFPLGFIALGLFLILRPKRKAADKWKEKTAEFNMTAGMEPGDNNTTEGSTYTEEKVYEDDYLDSVNVFGGSKQHVFSKNFKGGDVVSVFGGCELNLTKADFKDVVTIDVVAMFGGMKIILPPTWEVKSEVAAIFGGVDDKRSIIPVAEQDRKIVRIKGVALFGGISIANF